MVRRTIEEKRKAKAEWERNSTKEDSCITIPPCQDPKRRKRLEKNDIKWLLYYFGEGCELDDPFWYEFTSQQTEMIKAIGHAIKHGGDQALAASRGEGKTTISERLLLKYTLTGEVNYSVLFAASGTMAENSLDAIKTAIADNVRLAADYPEVCIPVQSLEGAPQRANTMRVRGHRFDDGKPYDMVQCKFSWCGQEIIFPDVPGSPSARAIIATRGLDAAVRGLKKRGKRPKIAVIDDPDTEDTARSEEQAKKLERRIDAAIGGLGGQQRGVGRVMITTCQSRIAASYLFTDPKLKPTFKGKRFRFLVRQPERVDLWEEYVQLRLEDLQSDNDEFCRRSHKFYIDNRKSMDNGAEVSNKYRFDGTKLPDGTKLEESALQRYYNEVARLGKDVVATEYDNDPPEESAVVESGINPTLIQKKVNGYERRMIPPGAILLTQGIDVRKVALHWVIRAWAADGTGHTIDYGIHEVRGTTYGSDEGVDVAVRRAIMERLEATKDCGFMTTTGDRLPVDLTLVDAGWRTDAVYSACYELGTGVMPVMGFGKSSGCVQTNFGDYQRRTLDKKPGDGWFLSRKGKLWLVCADTDRWKAWEHDRWLTSAGKAGSMQIFGVGSDKPDRMSDDQKSHHSYARHICNEIEVEEPYRGVIRRAWKPKSDNTHWLDASYYSDVAASIRGVRLSISSPSKTGRKESGPRKTLSEMAEQAKV